MTAFNYMSHMDNLFNELIDLDNSEELIHEWMDLIDDMEDIDYEIEATTEKFNEWLHKNK